MPKIHGRKTVLLLAGTDLGVYANNNTFEVESDEHDLTTYGKNSHVFDGGLLKSAFTVSGFYDSTAVTGPSALIYPLIGTVVAFTVRPEGTGSGLPQRVVSVLVKKFAETAPVADYITWALDLTGSDDINYTAQ